MLPCSHIKPHVFVLRSLVLEETLPPLLCYKGLCNLGVLRDFLFNKKGKIEDKLADRNPLWTEARSRRSHREEMMPAGSCMYL